jgi:hypothetical protein
MQPTKRASPPWRWPSCFRCTSSRAW